MLGFRRNIFKLSRFFLTNVSSITSKEKPPYIFEEDVQMCLKDQWSTLVSQMEKGFASLAGDNVMQPLRTNVDVIKYKGDMDVMPAYEIESEILGAKILTNYRENPGKGLPLSQAIILLFNASNGSLKAIIEGETITNMRTAASSMVATKYLATKDPKVVAMLGSGNQAHSHYHAIKHFYNVEKFNVWDVNEEMGTKLADEIAEDGYESEFFTSVAAAVKEADIVNVATLANEPVLKKKFLKEGVHVNAVGAAHPDCRELDDDLLNSSIVYVDSIQSVKAESGDIIQSGAEIYAEIGELANGTKEAFPSKTTVFKSVGMAIEDLVSANLVYELYNQKSE